MYTNKITTIHKCCPLKKNVPTITHLTLGEHFNDSIGWIPPSITHLAFGECFNQPVDHLPPSITHLTFGEHF
jgi:hypothetical protein